MEWYYKKFYLIENIQGQYGISGFPQHLNTSLHILLDIISNVIYLMSEVGLVKSRFKHSGMKYFIGFLVCLGIRMIPFRPPNVEPIMTTTMPFGKKWGWLAGGLFGMLSIILYDIVHPTAGFARIGSWTVVTAAMYGLTGAAAGLYLKNKENKVRHYVGFAVVATLAYDFITGPIMSSYMFQMPFMVTLVGQVPFTLLHLAGNVFGAALVSPLLYRWVVDNPKLDTDVLYTRLKHVAVG
jgi:uncharacterized membrane protein